MTKSAHIRIPDIRAINQLVWECRELGEDPMAWRHHCFAKLAVMTDSDAVVGGELAGLRGGAPHDLGYTTWGAADVGDLNAWTAVFELYPEISGSAATIMQNQSMRMRKLITQKEGLWGFSVEVKRRRAEQTLRLLYCLRAIPHVEDEVNGAVFVRTQGERDFSLRESGVIWETLSLLAPFVGGPLARFGEPAPGELSSRCRDVLSCLLEGDGDKEISKRLALSQHTVNEYVKQIFKHFHVRSRAELLARWIKRGWGTERLKPNSPVR